MNLKLMWSAPAKRSVGGALARRSLTAAWLALLLLAVAGCAGPGPNSVSDSARLPIDELNLVTMPVAVNVTSQPGGANGIAVKVFASDREHPKTQRITQGTLEVLMFDGLVHQATSGTNRALHVWSFPATELSVYSNVTTVGTGYFFSLAWGNDRPRKNQITVVARYLPPRGAALYSTPSFISLAPAATSGQ